MESNAKIKGDSDFAHQYMPEENYSLMSEKDYLKDLLWKQPGDYRLPLPLIDKVHLRMLEIFREQKDKDKADRYIPLAGQGSLSPYWKVILEYLYRAGVLQTPNLYYGRIFHDEPKIYTLRLMIQLSDGILHKPRVCGRGVSYDFNEAVSKVIGELLERYPLIFHKKSSVKTASVAELRKKKAHFLDPFSVDNFSPEQKKHDPRMNFTEQSRFRWVEGFSLTPLSRLRWFAGATLSMKRSRYCNLPSPTVRPVCSREKGRYFQVYMNLFSAILFYCIGFVKSRQRKLTSYIPKIQNYKR